MTEDVPIRTGSDARGGLIEVDAAGHESSAVVVAIKASMTSLSGTSGPSVWVDHPSTDLDAALNEMGLLPQRDLYVMDVHLPLSTTATIATRPFVTGQDESSWVSVNNRAFAWHREQSGWTLDDVQDRLAETWFDPNGFLMHEDKGKLLGFCWTKLHADLDPPAGEIYVIAVDPDGQGRGLGRELTIAGLESIHERGISRGFLYVDADNTRAVSMYVNLGFKIETIRRLYI